ncbi:Crp/Fnr family transcriptional regulator [Phyllobacterium sp. 21LDTY02-6]|jgi:CRP-like cAMP-binding protein|uniref:Crp/Fnr family transcriptional regulator n=1 Tax=unclassified Phyllobacterium TaxID=2638441 RepID=UPI0020212C27|nr:MULTISPECIES: Crp/Fnr family transcriptional regulator [unclassified Phyllobacterium]MCO4318824.1 Crp/Fnr family transcriptional regulator [Phyllobacterium sp. 21LDTY02-6]MCX8281906.1 Crp/Fnr family transcriptional regulator [Phyllobacterium sp. 0TCS1.6C]MCX8295441.1 Crp/Fnr family transcriptional regulator [Phyllobacterium sp. 0TCS1.6A]
MTIIDPSAVQNYLLRKLPIEAFHFLSPVMKIVDLPLKRVLVETNQPNSHVFFIEQGLASVVASTGDDESIEVGHVGYEGVSGAHIVLRADRTPNRTFMQVEGIGVSVPVVELEQMFERFNMARELFLKYVHTAELQLAHSALANARYNMQERLARWLLMCHDRLRVNDLALTHEFLALMLGVRRSGVTNEIHVLEGMHAIKATRGNIRIVDRSRLEEIAGGCYGVPEREYERLIGNPFLR